jgi:putative aldouronate transport system substrate-binding protein
MKKRVKILVALGVATVMSMSALAGCAGKSTGTSSAQATKEVKKPDKILWYINVGLSAQQKYEEWKTDFTKKTGIELDFTPMNNNDYKQNLELAFASKKAPDVFNLAGEDELPRYAAQGALADLTDLVKNSGLLTDENKAAWDSVTIDGKIYGVPFELNAGTVTYVRKDWLDKLGLQIPTTYDEYINMLRKFKTLPECKIPVTGAKLYEDMAVTYLKDFYQDATPEFTKVDGKWVDGLSQPNMKSALKRMQDAYSEGLLDQEVVTNTTSACRDKWFSGSVGAFNYWGANWAPQLDDRVKANVPTAEIVAIPPIKESKNYLLRVPAVTCIAKDCKNVEGVFKYFLQYMHDGGEGQTLFQNGAEGVHWKQDGDHITMLENPENPKEVLQKAFYAPYAAITPMKDKTKNIVVDKRVTAADEILAKYGIQSLTRPVSKKLAKINGDLTKLKAKSIASIVMGKTSVDEGLKAYESESKNLGIDEVIKEMNGSK